MSPTFERWVSNVGGNEAIVEHMTNPDSRSWYGHWLGLKITLCAGRSSVTEEWSYSQFCNLNKNEHGDDSFDVTGQAVKAQRVVVEYLESLGYFVVS